MAGLRAVKISSAMFSKLTQRLESMADGIKKHSGDPSPLPISEESFRKMKVELEDRRQRYEQLLADAKKAYAEYSQSYRECRSALSKAESTVYGRYGKRAPELADFGMKPWKKGLKKPGGQ